MPIEGTAIEEYISRYVDRFHETKSPEHIECLATFPSNKMFLVAWIYVAERTSVPHRSTVKHDYVATPSTQVSLAEEI